LHLSAASYEFTVDDPATWVKPWTAQYVMGPALGQIYESPVTKATTVCATTSTALARKKSARRKTTPSNNAATNRRRFHEFSTSISRLKNKSGSCWEA
jgi:hypothetical protein